MHQSCRLIFAFWFLAGTLRLPAGCFRAGRFDCQAGEAW